MHWCIRNLFSASHTHRKKIIHAAQARLFEDAANSLPRTCKPLRFKIKMGRDPSWNMSSAQKTFPMARPRCSPRTRYIKDFYFFPSVGESLQVLHYIFKSSLVTKAIRTYAGCRSPPAESNVQARCTIWLPFCAQICRHIFASAFWLKLLNITLRQHRCILHIPIADFEIWICASKVMKFSKQNEILHNCLQKFARRFGLHFRFPTLILQ